MLAPALLLVGGLLAWPVLNGVHLAFTSATPLKPAWSHVGLDNFAWLIEDPEFRAVVRDTLSIVGSATILATAAGYALAVLLDSGLRWSGLDRTSIFRVWVVPWIVIAILRGWLFAQDYGVVNDLLRLGLTEGGIKRLFDPLGARAAIVTGYTWRAIPFIMIICLAGLQGIPKELGEQAALDGAGFWARQRFVVLPLLRNVILVAGLLQAVRFL